MDTYQEEAFVSAFIVSTKRDRYLQFLSDPKQRQKAFRSFYHNLETLPARTTPIANRDNSPSSLEKMLRQKGASPTCYIISPESQLDQREMPLIQALEILIMQDGVGVICCIPGRLAYYKAEIEQYVLENK